MNLNEVGLGLEPGQYVCAGTVHLMAHWAYMSFNVYKLVMCVGAAIAWKTWKKYTEMIGIVL